VRDWNRLALVVLLLALVAHSGCVQFAARRPRPEPLRLAEVSGVGDPARRASVRLVVSGLDYDVEGSPARALSSYERAIQVDATNPYAYLAIARHRIAYGEPSSALALLDQAESLLGSRDEISPRVAVHLTGLRGWALYEEGDVESGAELLVEASRQAPGTWGDGRLSAQELR
jgi:tetratricopeptide (TPR) repeat protein